MADLDFTAEELWMLYGAIHVETERREADAFQARHDPLAPFKATDAAAWRTIRAKLRLAIAQQLDPERRAGGHG